MNVHEDEDVAKFHCAHLHIRGNHSLTPPHHVSNGLSVVLLVLRPCCMMGNVCMIDNNENTILYGRLTPPTTSMILYDVKDENKWCVDSWEYTDALLISTRFEAVDQQNEREINLECPIRLRRRRSQMASHTRGLTKAERWRVANIFG